MQKPFTTQPELFVTSTDLAHSSLPGLDGAESVLDWQKLEQISAELISRVTDAVLEEVSDWQTRALEPVYPIVFLDALRVKIRDADSRQVKNKAVYVALGVTPRRGTRGSGPVDSSQ